MLTLLITMMTLFVTIAVMYLTDNNKNKYTQYQIKNMLRQANINVLVK